MIETSNLKRELFIRLLKKEGLDAARAIPRRSDDGSHLLSFAQRRLWFLDQFAPGNPAYNIPAAFRLEGKLDVDVLQRSLNQIIKRHSVLRTIFTTVESAPVQVVLPSLTIEMPAVDLRAFDSADRETQVLRLMSEESLRPFDLNRGPLLRVRLLRLCDDEHILLLTMHHIVADGWSLSVFLRELSALYEAGVTGENAALPELAIQYSDFAQWERERLQGEFLENHLGYWKNKLAAAPPALPLPTDFPRPARQSFLGARCEFTLSPQLSESLKSLSRQEDCTLFMTLLAAFQTLLLRYTSQNDIAIGTSITNRGRVETERLIGLFINTLVLRTDLSGNPSFRELLRRVREVMLQAYAHQELPFEKLVEELQPQRELSHSPLFQVMFVLQNAPAVALKLPGLKVSLIDRHNETAKFDLLLSMVETPAGLTGSFEYSTDLFEAETVERLRKHFQVLLESIVNEPDRTLSDLQILTPAEQHRLLVEWNETAIDRSSMPLVHEQFELQAAGTPAAVAITFGTEQLTYGELNARANQLAHALRRLGVGADVLVGLFTERSLDMIIGLLGILKAGGAYLPLDPNYPRERIAFMLQDSAAPVVLTQQHLSTDLPAHQAEVLCLDSEWQSRIAPESTENLASINFGEHLAFTIYTSGSTGRPKGVQLSQGALVNLVAGMQQQLQLTSRDVWLAVTSLSFDIGTLEFCLPLLLGARVVLVGREIATDGAALSVCLRESGATMMQATPASWRMLLAAGWTGNGPLKILCGGEALQAELVEALLEYCRGGRVWNGYGPTETTIYSLVSVVEDPGRITIGGPLANTQVYVLDAHLQPVPTGAAGELYIGGEGLARGYLKRPELTAERFIPNPFSMEGGKRLYRTGDVVRYLRDGAIEYVGRNDYQVKVRGYRIELAEIESVLTQHPGVLQSVVMAREAAAGDVRLAAYVVPDEAQAWPSQTDLRNFLSERLPGFMVPSTFMLMEAFPLTPNAKVDRKALPAPDWGQTGAQTAYVPPRTPFEEVLAGIWSQLLGIERVGMHDNFFELGGHSLLATTLVSRLREVFQVELPLRRLFETPTLAEIAEAVQSSNKNKQGIAPLKTRTRDEHLPLSFSQQRLWFLDQLTPGTPAYNLVGALRLHGSLDVSAMERSLNEIVKRHEILRTTFVTVDGQPEQVVTPSLTVMLPLVRLDHLPTAERDTEAVRLIAEESRYSFNLSRGPLLRALVLQLGDRENILVLNMHHIVSDGWSIGILLRELTAFYTGFVKGEPTTLPDLPIHYADFATWQRQWLEGQVLESQLSYWKRQLEGALPLLELPADRQRPVVQTYEGERQSFVLSEALTTDLKTLSQREGVTVFMTLLAVFKTLLHRLTGQDDIVVGSPIAGRNRAETENLIGFFVNTLVLRTDLSGRPAFRELLRRVRETALGAYSNQEVPFEQLLEALQPKRNMSHTPLFQVFFNMLNLEENTLELPGLATEVLPPLEVQAKFDLTVYVEEENRRLKFAFVYNASLFTHERVAEMMAQLRQLLTDVLSHPEESIDAFTLVTPTAQKFLPEPTSQLRATWKGAVHTQFIEQVRRAPLHAAVVDRYETLSYQELDARSNQLAQYLIAHGVEPQDVVPVYAQRSAALVLTLLGIVKAGAAFVVLDPSYPVARLLGYLEAIRPKGWIRIREAGTPHTMLQAYENTFSFNLELGACSDANALDDYSTAETGVTVGPEDIAYVAFTSGSTGRPKPIVGKHGSLAHFAPWANQMFGIGQADRFSMLSGLSHDPFHRDVFMPLQLGGTICIPDPEDMSVPGRLATWMDQQQITVSNLTPAMGQVISASHRPADFRERQSFQLPAWRHLFFVGDVLTRRDIARVRMLAPAAEIINLYGTTETSRALSYYIVPPDEVDSGKEIVPLGRGISEVQLIVMNAAGKQAGAGELGEIYFRSPHLAKGYLGDEQLTRERFLANPFTHDPADLIYQTGDLGRYLPDGNVEPLGRADSQVQIRGFRVEPGEIEALIGRHHAVSESAVIAREDVPGEKHLVAYIVPAAGSTPNVSELRTYLKNELADYMVPASFVMLGQLPLTPNGKLDRRALPAPVQVRASDGPVESRSAVEEILADTWAEILRVEHIGVHENFFELGGHSLMAIQVMSRVRDRLQVELPVRTLFESPTVSTLSKVIESARKTDVFSFGKPLAPQSREGSLPLSFAQQRLWFLDQLQPGLGVYNIPAAVRLTGLLNPDALEKSLNAIINRHEALRTTFASVKGQPEQLIASSLAINIALTDLEGLPEDEQASEIERLTLLETQRSFDLTHGPLLRAMLLRLREDEHVLVVTIHHIVSDAWSLGVLVRELSAFYEAFAENTKPVLAELPVQYADFALWQREWLQGDVLEAQLGYWKEQLGGQLPVLELPTDRPRPPVPSFRGAKETFTLSPELSDRLNLLCREEGVTLFMLLLAAFQTLLYRYSGQTDILVGTPIAGRSRSEIQNLIGFFVNTLVMRGRFSGAFSFRELLAVTRETALDAYAHEDVPFEKIVEALRLERDTNREALFQVMLVLQNAPTTTLKLKGLEVDLLPIHNQTAKFDLVLSLHEHDGGLEGNLEYSTDLFDDTTIKRMTGHFEVLLQSIAENCGQQLDELPLLSAKEEHYLLVELNDTGDVFGKNFLPQRRESSADKLFVQSQFEAQAARTPEDVAVVFQGQQLSYRELNRRANQLAHFLRGAGVGPEALVGILMERSPEMIVGLLGVLKAGGAYVPLDPSYPQERLDYITRDARMSVVLTQERLRGLSQADNVRVLAIDKDWPAIETCSRENPAPMVTVDNLAYVIYTSGSTGRPKGVMVPHRGFINYLSWCSKRYEAEKGCGSPVHSSLSFDLTITSLFPPLLAGKTVFLLPEADGIDGLAACLLERDDYSLVKITPAHLIALSALLPAEMIRGRVGALVIGGEALHMENLSFWRRHAPDTRLINEYGPTETVVGCCVYEVGADDPQAGTVPIGRMIANTQIYLLNERLRPVPVGVAGELYIGGVDLARGYLNSPELTAQRFIPNPFSADPGERLYKTGDSARYLPDGNIEYLDRLDNQVKIRGFRIELGEIEAVLRQTTGVQKVLVLARDNKGDGKYLVAYVVREPSVVLETEQLRNQLQEKLPPYMVPAHFVFLDEFPLTTNGKVDRQGLPAPATIYSTQSENSGTPLNQMEEILADIWAGVLGLERVGRDDDFFDLGGHSLLATKLVYRIQETLGVTLPLRRIFEGPTVAAAAGIIEQLRCSGGAPVLPSIERAERNRELPLSFAQQRLWILDQLTPDTYNQHSAIRLRGALNVHALEQSLNEIVRRHEILRTTFITVAGQPAQSIAASLTLKLCAIDLRHLPRRQANEEVQRLIVEERRCSFNLAQGPLLRIVLVRTRDDEHVVLLSLPHIVFDGWSNAILIQEAVVLYKAFAEGLSSPLPELPVQYADFAVWQREWLQAEIFETQLAYWKRQLEAAPITLQLPGDGAKPQREVDHRASLPLLLPAALADDLKVLSRQHSVTLFMTLLAAFKILLYSYSGQTDIVVGTNVANRTRSETERLIGFFINLLVLRTDLSGAPSFGELLARVREITLQALAHQDLPFEKLVSELKLDRDQNQTPLVRVVMQLQSAPRVPFELPGLTAEFLEIGAETVPFDLVLNVLETESGLAGAWLYNSKLFDATTISRMASRFELLLQQLVAEPDMNLDEIVATLKQAEKRQFKNTRQMKLRNVQLHPVIAST